LLYEDFDENVVELPPSRSDTDETLIQFLVAMHRFISIYGMISDLTTSTRPSSYAEVMRLDGILHETYKANLVGLQMRSMEDSTMDSGEAIIKSIYLALMFQGAQCIWHRKYLLLAGTDRRYIYARMSCIEAALQILQHQRILHQEMHSGGRLYQDRWRVSSIVKQTFLLATTILCLDLDQDITAEASLQSSNDMLDLDARERMMQALHGSYLIWLDASESSREAHKATEVLRIVLGKAQKMGMRRSAGFGVLVPNMADIDSHFVESSTGRSDFIHT
jgi:hypothetical protein